MTWLILDYKSPASESLDSLYHMALLEDEDKPSQAQRPQLIIWHRLGEPSAVARSNLTREGCEAIIEESQFYFFNVGNTIEISILQIVTYNN